MRKPYVKPLVKTLDANRIVDSMGPVSCGSGAGQNPLPAAANPSGTAHSGGYRDLQ